MIRISQIKLRPGQSPKELESRIRKILKLRSGEVFSFSVVKCAVDARKKPDVFYSYTVDVSGPAEPETVKRSKSSQVSIVEPVSYHFPESGAKKLEQRPVIIGTGPAGLFCGYMLARQGYRPVLLERGMDVKRRKEEVERFWETGRLNPNCNVQFGEGGAGTFSDGKLNTLVKDKDGRNKEVLSIFVEAGAPEHILYEGKPHIGTDILMDVVEEMRRKIIAWGGEVRFDTKVTDLVIEAGRIKAVMAESPDMGEAGNEEEAGNEREESNEGNDSNTANRRTVTERIETQAAVLAIGHSARDTFEMLYGRQVPMEAKAFAVGLRTEHKQSMIDRAQYGREERGELPPASYKLTAKTKEGRGVYSFCMCPGGYVVNASSEEGRLAVNGMSYSKRDGEHANSAIIVSVTPEDFDGSHPLSGVAFQEKLEEKAYAVGRGRVPVETYGEFKKHVTELETKLVTELETEHEAEHVTKLEAKHEAELETKLDTKGGNNKTEQASDQPQIRGQWRCAPVHEIMPEPLNRAFVEGMEQFGRIIPGFAADDVLLSGIESRTSSPVRIHRDDSGQSEIRGLYPCGEGAGYAGGIMSAAMDGIRTAELIAKEYKAEES